MHLRQTEGHWEAIGAQEGLPDEPVVLPEIMTEGEGYPHQTIEVDPLPVRIGVAGVLCGQVAIELERGDCAQRLLRHVRVARVHFHDQDLRPVRIGPRQEAHRPVGGRAGEEATAHDRRLRVAEVDRLVVSAHAAIHPIGYPDAGDELQAVGRRPGVLRLEAGVDTLARAHEADVEEAVEGIRAAVAVAVQNATPQHGINRCHPVARGRITELFANACP